MSDREILNRLLCKRRAHPAEKAALDAEIEARFGRRKAVMFTDLVGFSRSVDAFGIVHFLQIIQESEALFLPIVAQHSGQCHMKEGDSLLITFDEPVDALACAQAMIAATADVNVGRADEERMEVCIGIGFGQVLWIDGETVWGAEVNMASKLGEDIARGGQVLVTQRFRQTVPDVPFVEHGQLFERHPYYRLVRE